MNSKLKYLLVIVFGISIYLIPVSSLLDIKTQDEKEFHSIERRSGVSLDKWSWSITEMKYNFLILEKFVNDRYAFRNDLLNLHARISVWLGQSPNRGHVVIGKEGWLFFNSNQYKLMRQYQGREPLTQKEIKLWKNYFLGIQKYLNKKNIEFILAIAPDKHSIYPEYLPSYFSKKGLTPFDQIRRESARLNIIDLHKKLINNKALTNNLLYFKTDTHWNKYGAYIAYTEISSGIRFPDFQKLIIPDSCFNSVDSIYNSDLQLLIRLPNSMPDQIYSVTGSCFGSDSIYKCSDLSFMDGSLLKNGQFISIINSHFVLNKSKMGRALIIGDSFMIGMSAYFNSSFGSICYKHVLSNQKENLMDIVNEFEPDIVIWEMVERTLKLPLTKFFRWGSNDELNVFYSFNMGEVVNKSKFNKFIKNKYLKEDGLQLKSTGNDPSIILPKVSYPPESFVVEVDMSSNVPGKAEIFYLTEKNVKYSSQYRETTSVIPGRQILRFNLNGIDVNGKLRFDPCNKKGEFTIHSIKLYSLGLSNGMI